MKPIKERIWLWLKDHPEHTSLEVQAALRTSLQETSSTLSQLYYRGMLTRVQKKSPNLRGAQVSWSYSTSSHMRNGYELLPMPKNRVLGRKSPKTYKGVPLAPKALPTTVTEVLTTMESFIESPGTPQDKLEDIINSLTVREAVELSNRLKTLFAKA